MHIPHAANSYLIYCPPVKLSHIYCGSKASFPPRISVSNYFPPDVISWYLPGCISFCFLSFALITKNRRGHFEAVELMGNHEY